MKNINKSLPVILILVISILFRASFSPAPFWVDEFNSGIQAVNLLSIFQSGDSSMYIENNNYFSHFLIAIFFKAFGQSESIARLPFMIAGSLVPVAIYFLAKKLFDFKTAISSALLVSLSYFELAWSNQARGYVLQQLISSLLFLFYYEFLIIKKKYSIGIPLVLLISIFGLLTHNMFIIPIFSLIVHFMIFNFKLFIKFLKNPKIFITILMALIYLIFKSFVYKIFASDLFSLFNNIWYYHALLWREYGIIILLALIGIIWGIKNKLSESLLLLIFIVTQLIFVTFFFGHYMSKYILPIFHFLVLLSGLGIATISDSLVGTKKNKKLSLLFVLIITVFIIINGDKFVFKPKNFYSVNHDMRDIAIVDYNKVYNLIKKKSNNNLSDVAVIDTWPDRPKWYLGINFPNIYHFRWSDNGFRKKTNFYLNNLGEKIVIPTNNKLVSELTDLEKAMTKYPKGFIWIDDTSLPADVIKYVEKNFYKELYLDHYPLDDNPYSIWPGTLYSWGFETENPFYSKPSTDVIE